MPFTYDAKMRPVGELPAGGWQKVSVPPTGGFPQRSVYRKAGRNPQGLQVIEVRRGQLYHAYPGGTYHNTLREAQDAAEARDAEVWR